MDPIRKKSPSDYLVSEQPGMVVLLSGLIFSFLCGYIIKSYLSPARVAAQVEKAASHIHKDVKVSFSSAQLSLSDGFLPRFAVIISDVKMTSENKCWSAPSLEVDQLRLPLSLWSLLRGGSPVLRIEANKVQLVLREALTGCASGEGAPVSKGPPPLVSLSPSEPEKIYQNNLRSLYIQEFRIVAEKYPQISSELLQFAVKVKSFEPKVIEVTAKTHLLKDKQVGDYLSHANLYLQYQEVPQIKIQSHFFGNWREGHYSLIANYTPEENILAVEADLKHIPLSQIIDLLKKYRLISQELNGRQVWLSSKARLVTSLDQLRQAPLEIKDFRVEGDLGDLRVEQVRFSSLDPLKYSPIAVDIRKLDIEKLLLLLNRPENSPILGHLGVFTGRAEIQSDQKIKLNGEHRGLEFVFSNKGQRELQVVDRMVGDVELSGNKWNFSIRRVEPVGGLFIGDVKLAADRDFHDVSLKARVDEVLLDPVVQKLMTGGGDVGPLNLDFDAKVKAGKLDYLKGVARLDGMKIEGLSFGKAKVAMDWAQGEVVLNSQIKSLEVLAGSPGAEVLRQVTLPSWWSNDSFTMQSLSGTFSTRELQRLSWKNIHGQVGKNGKFMTEGSWDENGVLKGSVYNRDGKVMKGWQIKGDRSNPGFAEIPAAEGKALRK